MLNRCATFECGRTEYRYVSLSLPLSLPSSSLLAIYSTNDGRTEHSAPSNITQHGLKHDVKDATERVVAAIETSSPEGFKLARLVLYFKADCRYALNYCLPSTTVCP